jgi:hypothetical protein
MVVQSWQQELVVLKGLSLLQQLLQLWLLPGCPYALATAALTLL